MTTFTQPKAQYLDLYGFRTVPFGLSPDPDFFYPAPTHMSAGKILSHAIANGEGFMVLTGRAGLGKTLLLRRILEGLDKRKIPVLILSPAVDATGLLQLLLGEIGLDFNEQTSPAQLLQIFQNHILNMAQQDLELFIVVDEAQNMPLQTLEQLRMLSNLETGKRKLMQILLIGQTGLEQLLTDPKLGQLAQRIVVNEKLQPLTLTQVARYVEYRLKRARGENIRLSPSAIKLLHGSSRGTPRLINRIMDRTLLLASLDSTRDLTRSHVKTAISTMKDIGANNRRIAQITKPLALTAVTAILAILVYFWVTSAPISLLSKQIQANSIWSSHRYIMTSLILNNDSDKSFFSVQGTGS